MTEWIDFAEVRAKVSLEVVLLEMYGLGDRLKRQGKKLFGSCPIHQGDSPRAFQVDLEKNVYFCFSGCRKGGNAIDFVVAMEGIPVREAALRLQARFLGAPASPSATARPAPAAPAATATITAAAPAAGSPVVAAPPNTARPALAATISSPGPMPGTTTRPDQNADAPGATNPPLTVRLTLDPSHPHLVKERGLKAETAALFGLGYCARGILRGTIAIPVHDEDGDLVAYAGRRLKSADIRELGKYKLPKGFRKDLVLYNLDRAKALPRDEGLVLVEGFFATATLHERGVPNVVASMGAKLSEAQADLLAEYTSHVTVLYDGDDAGRGGADEALQLLDARSVKAGIVRLPDLWKPETAPARLLRWAVQGVRLLALHELRFTPSNPAR